MREIQYKGETIKVIAPGEIPHQYKTNQRIEGRQYYRHCQVCGKKPTDLIHYWGS